MTTRDLVMILIGFVVGGVATWSLNRQLLKAAYAIERARHHYAAMTAWISTLFRDLRRLAMLAALLLTFVSGAGYFLYWLATSRVA